MRSKPLALAGLAAALFALRELPADAHTPKITSTCTTVTVDLTAYEPGSTVSVWLGGKLATRAAVFGPDYKQTYLLDTIRTYRVVINNKGDRDFDVTLTGTAEPCQVPVPTPTTTTEPAPVPPPVVLAPPVVVTATPKPATPAVPVEVPRISFTG